MAVETIVSNDVAQKHDSGKPMLDLVDPWAVIGLAHVLTFGAKKYSANQWRIGISYSRLIAALDRHLQAIKQGEDIDPESGHPHIDHLGCCWMFLSNFMKTRKDLDDRWKPTPQHLGGSKLTQESSFTSSTQSQKK